MTLRYYKNLHGKTFLTFIIFINPIKGEYNVQQIRKLLVHSIPMDNNVQRYQQGLLSAFSTLLTTCLLKHPIIPRILNPDGVNAIVYARTTIKRHCLDEIIRSVTKEHEFCRTMKNLYSGQQDDVTVTSHTS